MAKGKQTAALFDVIHASKRPPKASPGGKFPTPKWFGKGKAAASDVVDGIVVDRPTAVSAAESAGGGGTQTSWLAKVREAAEERAANGVSPAADGLPASLADDDTDADERLLGVPRGAVAAAAQVHAYHDDYEAVMPTPVLARPAASPPLPLPTFGTDAADDGPAWGDDPTVGRDPTRPFRPADRRYPEPVEPRAVESRPVAAPVSTKPVVRPIASIRPPQATLSHPGEPPVSVDRTAREVRFRLTYPALAASAAAMALGLTVAFLVGRHSTGGESTAPMMMAKSPATTAGAGQTTAASVVPRGPVVPNPIGGVAAGPHVGGPPVPPVSPAVAAKRQVGARYVVLFYGLDEAAAQTRATYLSHAGIPCSLVRGPRKFAPDGYFSVVGMQPFAVPATEEAAFFIDPQKSQPTDLLAYAQKAGRVLEQFAPGTTRKASPMALSLWTADDAAAAEAR